MLFTLIFQNYTFEKNKSMIKTTRYILIILVLTTIVIPQVIVAQSKTDKVEDKLDGNDKSGSSGNTSGNTSSSSSGGPLSDFFVELVFQTFRFAFTEIFYIEKYSPEEDILTYNPYPYYPYGYEAHGLRNYNSTKQSSFSVNLDLSRPPLTAWDTNYGISAEYSFQYWGLHSSYRMWDEEGSLSYMHQFDVALERKMRYFPNAEAGFLLGYQRTTISGNRYNGLMFGFESDYYWFKPVSAQFNWRGTLYENTSSNFIQTGLRYHLKNAAITLNYQVLDFEGIVFKGINLGYAVWF
jgi:hypothetical protein